MDNHFGKWKNEEILDKQAISIEENNTEQTNQTFPMKNENEEQTHSSVQGDKAKFEVSPHYATNFKNDSRKFYSEVYTKPKKKNRLLLQLVAVSLTSAILGGCVVGGFNAIVMPAISPYVKEKVSTIFPNTKFSNNLVNTPNNPVTLKKVEIETTTSPIVAIAEKVGPSVVGIKVTARSVGSWPFGDSQSNPEGSGIIIRGDGYIMTNNHVIADAVSSNGKSMANGSKIEVILPSLKDKPYSAVLVGRDIRTDLAVLKIEATNLPAIEMGNSDNVKVGEMAIAIGNPGGLEYMGSVTAGIISGLNRTVPIEDGKELRLLQTDAAINPGNSGGALVNSKGQLIGINTAKIGGQGFEGLGFAIPVNQAKKITDSLIEFKYVKGRPMLGIATDPRFDEAAAKKYNVPVGVLVSDVTPFSGAYRAGIQIEDIITKFAGKPVKTVDEINTIKNTMKPGDEVSLEIYREGEYKTIKVKLTEENR